MEMRESFAIGQIFEDDYPEKAAEWCTLHQKAYIVEIEPVTREVVEWFETPAAYDDDGSEIPESASSWSETIEKKVRRFQIVAVAAPTPKELAEAALAQAKAERAAAVAAITVTVDGMTFDGDEKAQERMARAVLMAESPEESMEWVLADSSVAIVTAAQLRRACRAAGKAMGALWVVPYTS